MSLRRSECRECRIMFDLRPQALYFCLVSNVQEDVRLLTSQVGFRLA